MALWKIAAWITLGCVFAFLLLATWVFIESALHAAKLRRMQRETDERRQAQRSDVGGQTSDKTRRARYLP
jgi:hypothetical protein